MEDAHHDSLTVTLSFPSRPHNIVTLALSRTILSLFTLTSYNSGRILFEA